MYTNSTHTGIDTVKRKQEVSTHRLHTCTRIKRIKIKQLMPITHMYIHVVLMVGVLESWLGNRDRVVGYPRYINM